MIKRLPLFSRSQLGVILLLGAALLLLYAWRANFGRPLPPAPAQTLNLVFVEVAGAVAHPGLYSFMSAPTLAEVFRKAGGAAQPPSGDPKIASGSLITVAPDGQYQVGRLPGATLVALGLALDLNTATAADLDALPGIGPALAQRIIAYRENHGPFKKIEDLEQVSGLGPQKLAKLKPHVLIGDPEAAPPDSQ